MSAMSIKTEATIEDLYHVYEDGKAEIVNGEMLLMSPTGDLPGSAASESDYGPRAERARAKKCVDYFAAGTFVLWDVDVLKEEAVRVHRAGDPDNPRIYRRGEIADVELALPGWSMPVGDLFL
jgi:hypothetical protein